MIYKTTFCKRPFSFDISDDAPQMAHKLAKHFAGIFAAAQCMGGDVDNITESADGVLTTTACGGRLVEVYKPATNSIVKKIDGVRLLGYAKFVEGMRRSMSVEDAVSYANSKDDDVVKPGAPLIPDANDGGSNNDGGSSNNDGGSDFANFDEQIEALKKLIAQKEEEKAAAEQKRREEEEKKKREEEAAAAKKKADDEKKKSTDLQKYAVIAGSHGKALYFYGPAGTGKSTLAKKIANEQDLPFYTQSCVFYDHELFGFVDANGRFVETGFYKAFKDGGVFLLDEVDCSDVAALKKLNGAIANNLYMFPNGEIVERNAKCLIIGTGNTLMQPDSEYTAAQKIDRSTIDRFICVEILHKDEIENAICEKAGLPAVAEFVQALRAAKISMALDLEVSLRFTEKLLLLATLYDYGEAVSMLLKPFCDVCTLRRLQENINCSDSNEFYKAFKVIKF